MEYNLRILRILIKLSKANNITYISLWGNSKMETNLNPDNFDSNHNIAKNIPTKHDSINSSTFSNTD